MNRYIIGSLWDRSNRNGTNANFEYLFEGSKRVDELNQRADSILNKSNSTLNEAKQTNDMNKDVQEQINRLIISDGESDAEVIQARGEFDVLNERLESSDKEMSHKANKTDTIPISQLSKNSGLIDESFLSPTLKAQITGVTPISTDLAYGLVSPDHTNYLKVIHRNLFNKDTASAGWLQADGTVNTTNQYNSVSDYIEINHQKKYYTTESQQVAWYDVEKTFISMEYEPNSEKVLTPPLNAYFMRISFSNGKLNSLSVSDDVITGYYPFGTYEIVSIDDQYKEMVNKSITEIKANQTDFLIVTPSPNLVDESKIYQSSIVNRGDGNLVTSGIAVDYFTTDFILVEANSEYKATNSYDGAWYDNDKSFISGISGTGTPKSLTVPQNANYLRLTFSNTEMGKAMICKDSLPGTYTSFKDTGLGLKTETHKKTIADNLKPYLSFDNNKFKFSEWNTIGDSITEANSTASVKYHDIIKQKTGVAVNNYGYSGTGYLQIYSTNKAIWDRLDETSPTADLITVFAGTNDKNKPIGTFGDTSTTTLYGAIDTVLKGLITKFPTKTIAVFTPLPRNDDWSPGSTGTTMEMIADAIIKVAGKYSIPVLDLYRISNLHPWNATANSTLFSNGDGVHPNNAGHKIIADKILNFLNSL